MTEPFQVVCLSDEDDEDCIIESVTYKETDLKSFNFYLGVSEENQLLANFIEKCLHLDATMGMSKILKNCLLPAYYKVEKSVRTGPKVQRALQRANNLVISEPQNKFSHINDLCAIFKTLHVKKKVPFITLTTEVSSEEQEKKKIAFNGKDSNKNGLKTANTAQINAISNKKRKLNNNVNSLDTSNLLKENEVVNISKSINVVPEIIGNDLINKSPNENPGTSKKCKGVITSNTFSDSANEASNDNIPASKRIEVLKATSNLFNDTSDSLDGSTITEGGSQESCSDDCSLLEPVVLENQEKIKALEKKIALYKKKIEKLDEHEVVDDSSKSPYILSDRLKAEVVMFYKELCELTGSQVDRDKEIRLQVIKGHPPGPTRVLERFLNDNMDSNGDLPFPDFCDVVNCVTEANERDDLGWTRAQVMKEAYLLFTHYGRALQKRRQSREYKDLLRRVKKEERDPAEDDPELLARLEENKRISVKKESEILQKYTMMQLLPSKPKQKQETEAQKTKDGVNCSNNTTSTNETQPMDIDPQKCEDSSGVLLSDNDKCTMNLELKAGTADQTSTEELKTKVDEIIENKKEIKPHKVRCNKQDIECYENQYSDINTTNTSITMGEETPLQPCTYITNLKLNIDHNSNTDIEKNILNQDPKLQTESCEQVISSEENTECRLDNIIVDSRETPSDENNEHEMIGDENELLIKEIKREPEEDVMSMLMSLGDNFYVSIETISDPFLIVEISSDSSMSDEQ